jgi:ribosomal protein S12 methylthiotransferase
LKVNLVSLGCPKNLVDSEKILGALGARGASITALAEDCDVMILNTCAFIRPAIEETELEIQRAIQTLNNGKRLFVVGCAVNRYGAELRHKYPGVAGWFRIDEVPKLISTLMPGSFNVHARLPTTSGYAYLKISEGCSNNCAYCTIPSIKGPYRSFSRDVLVTEARELAALGIKELILIGQDTSRYGTDIYGRSMLAFLLSELSKIPGIEWLRVMYAHPRTITNDVIEEMKRNKKVCRYMDIPIQHINSRMLRAMNRGTNRDLIESVIAALRSIPGISIRTTIMVGYPGETESEFNELMEFVSRGYLDWVGVFPYYREYGTNAACMEQLPADTIRKRYETAIVLQQRLLMQNNEKRRGCEYRVLIHTCGPDCLGHSEFCAPEIDSQIHVADQRLRPGRFYNMKITGTAGSDLKGQVVRRARRGVLP